jgi:hypothetical protein
MVLSQIQVNALHQEIDLILGDSCQPYMLRELKEKMPPRQASDIVKYLYAMMDDSTRFMIAQQVAEGKYTQDVRPMFREAKEAMGKKPKTLISDGAFNFQQAY